MALCKEKIHPNGITTFYHRVSLVSVSGNTLYVELVSYVSQNYRTQGQPANFEEMEFEITLEEEESMGVRQLAYKKIKELPEWEGAEDC